MWCDLRLPRASCVQTERPRAEVRNQQSATEHGDILHKHNHLNLRHHGIAYCPEFMHHQRDWNQEQHDEPCPKSCAIAQQNAESAQDRQYARKRNRDRGQRYTLRSRIADSLFVKMIGSSHHEDHREQEPPQGNHSTLPKACCLRIFGNCNRIRCHVLSPFICLARTGKTTQTWCVCTGQHRFLSFSNQRAELAFSEAGKFTRAHAENLVACRPATLLASAIWSRESEPKYVCA